MASGSNYSLTHSLPKEPHENSVVTVSPASCAAYPITTRMPPRSGTNHWAGVARFIHGRGETTNTPALPRDICIRKPAFGSGPGRNRSPFSQPGAQTFFDVINLLIAGLFDEQAAGGLGTVA